MDSSVAPGPDLASPPPAGPPQASVLEDPTAAKRAKGQNFWRRYSRNVGSVVGAVLILFFALVSFFPSWFATHDPTDQDILHRFRGIGSPNHLLGSDQLGRDLYSRLVYGVHVT